MLHPTYCKVVDEPGEVEAICDAVSRPPCRVDPVTGKKSAGGVLGMGLVCGSTTETPEESTACLVSKALGLDVFCVSGFESAFSYCSSGDIQDKWSVKPSVNLGGFWFNGLSQSVCELAVNQSISGQSSLPLNFSLPISSPVVESYGLMMSNIISSVGIDVLTDPTIQLSRSVFNLCSSTPLECEFPLRSVCNMTPDSLSRDSNLLKWCGCHLAQGFYLPYEKVGVPKECTPTCNISGVLATTSVCDTSTCIIDDLSIDISQSGGLDISQTCNSCGSSSVCNCTIIGDTIIESSRRGDLSINQGCGSSSCFDDSSNQVDCQTGEPIQQPPTLNWTLIIWTLAIATVIVIVLISL